MKLPKELTTVTPLSKYFAMILFITLPFIGFMLGIRYQEMIGLQTKQEEIIVFVKPSPTPTPENISEWKTYTNEKYGFSLKHPKFLSLKEKQGISFVDNSSNIDGIILSGTFSGTNFTNTVLTIDLSLEINPNSLTIKNWINNLKEKEIKCRNNGCTIFDYIRGFSSEDKNITIDGRNAIAKDLTGISLSENLFVTLKPNKILWIKRYYNSFPEIEKEEKIIFDQILSTFKFLD